ncbi:MAG: hypothetical protein V4593_03505 [Pseudomonadota bacterium]
MSVLRNLFTPGKRSASASVGPETAPVRMDLDERMEFRREMLYEAIRFTMQAHGILSASYRFRVVRNDRRGHMYSVMMDLSTDFMHKREGRPAQLVALGAAIARNAATRYGLLVAGVYWRVNEEIQGFESSRPVAETGAGAATPELPAPDRSQGRARAEELAAFGDARQNGGELRFRDRVYASDLAPLGR